MTKPYFYKSLRLRRPPMEDDLKIIKLDYLSNHLLDHTQILNLSCDNQPVFYKTFKWRWPTIEDVIKILKAKYLSNYFSLYDKTIPYKTLKWRQTPTKDNLKILKVW